MKKYSEETVKKLLDVQVGNCWAAVNSFTKDEELLRIVKNTPEPGHWREKEVKERYYVALTEVTPIQIKPEVLTPEQVEKIFEAFKQNCHFPQEIKTEILPNHQIIKLSQGTFDFICNSAIIEQERFGEKTYRLNNQTFKIYEWDDYVNQFGEPNFTEKN